eukprot:Blabericola_migrator_1__6174@NODE_3115_length_2026_cov_242_843287_g1952_i0_p1_GENE_NODE_3115_length_2026_cov_242_843287_g1952_i0NODE_3115_length_2026_cov_242_843287_g1952_i0_p1_ORF_typecomplete_len347_score31_30Nucleoside_tran/PF01733_18/1_6e03Nucleoside_tran/PF01733_18/1_5e28CLN3/PF02487_17/7_1e05Fuseless/PF15993_5/9_3e03Fuseless/PF15993_5/2_8e03Fuseless/PF15993_5/0_0044Fuseless/PF15993_5/3e03Comm/PF15957_5/0_12_NODE_3115_length_2026_cov_242_843287_g1952_i08371877
METAIAVFMSCNLIALAVVLHFNLELNKDAFLFSASMLAITHPALALTATLCPDQSWLLLYIMSLGGFASGSTQGCAWGLAASTPTIQSGWVSIGNGLSGLVSFPLWMLLNSVLFPGSTLKSLWVISILGCCLCFVSCGAYHKIRADRRVRRVLREKIMLTRDFNRQPDHPTNCQLIKKGWQACVACFIVVYTSLIAYPGVAPLSWIADGRYHINLLLGAFQVGDFLGRYIPLLDYPWAKPKTEHILQWSCARVLLLGPICYESWTVMRGGGSFVYHLALILTLSLTNGWFSTAAIIRGVEKFKSFRHRPYRNRFSSLLCLCIVLGTSAGLWTCAILNLNKPMSVS